MNLTRKNSAIVSLRVTKQDKAEWTALAKEVGALAPRRLREAFERCLEEMRVEVDERRSIHGGKPWAETWVPPADDSID